MSATGVESQLVSAAGEWDPCSSSCADEPMAFDRRPSGADDMRQRDEILTDFIGKSI
jgi:hypothetical protein